MYLRLLTLLLLVATLTVSATHAQESRSSPAPKPATNDDTWSSFQAINATIDTVLMQYEQLTGKILIKDSNLAANTLPITISVRALPKAATPMPPSGLTNARWRTMRSR